MSEMKVLLLGWDLKPARTEEEEPGNGCFEMAKALGERVDLSMILPVSDPGFILKNVTLTGLNNINLPETAPRAPEKDIQPFAESHPFRQDIPLYGAPLQQMGQQATTAAEQMGQAASAGVLQQDQGNRSLEALANENIFDSGQLNQMTLDAQIIQYARWATRLAAHRNFDVIYAYDWRTFLAGSELKLVSEKPLVLQVHSLSLQQDNPNSQGWMYQVEIQALQKADCIIAATDELAALMEGKYHIAPELINSLESPRAEETTDTSAPDEEAAVIAGEETPAGLSGNKLANGINEGPTEVFTIKSEQNGGRHQATKKIRDILLQVAA
jgi:Glycosyltransferase Family 4